MRRVVQNVCHSRESGNPEPRRVRPSLDARFAGMTHRRSVVTLDGVAISDQLFDPCCQGRSVTDPSWGD